MHQVKGVHDDIIHTLNDIAALPSAEFGVHNVNEEYNIMVITMARMVIAKTPQLEINPKEYLYPKKISNRVSMCLLTKKFVFPKLSFPNLASMW